MRLSDIAISLSFPWSPWHLHCIRFYLWWLGSPRGKASPALSALLVRWNCIWNIVFRYLNSVLAHDIRVKSWLRENIHTAGLLLILNITWRPTILTSFILEPLIHEVTVTMVTWLSAVCWLNCRVHIQTVTSLRHHPNWMLLYTRNCSLS